MGYMKRKQKSKPSVVKSQSNNSNGGLPLFQRTMFLTPLMESLLKRLGA